MECFKDKKKIDECKDMSDEEILAFLSNFWNVTPNENGIIKLYASYQKSEHKDSRGNDFAFFIDVRNEVGDILYYPYKLGKVKIWSQYKTTFEAQPIWQINIRLSEKKHRKENPFALCMANNIVGKPSLKFNDRLEKESIIKKIFNETGYTQRDANNTVNALHNIMDDLYTNADDRFVYELLQNADDQPQEGKPVSVHMQLLEEHLLFMHNGRPFDKGDVDSICSIGSSTKRSSKEKIGYKGIGFKSVFTGSDTVIVNSGNFSFAFDKQSSLYNGANIESIPWQLKPIWQEKYRYPKEVKINEYFWKSQVGIALDIDSDKIEYYDDSIRKILSSPLFLLFLKNVSSLYFQHGATELKIEKNSDGNILHIKENENIISSWIKNDYVIEIPQDIRDAMQNDRNVPQKMKEATKTQISFAAIISDKQIGQIDNSILYAYLPTTVNDFKFNFIVNADFLLAANREQLHTKKTWNRFLFQQIGKLLVDWSKSISAFYPNYLNILPNRELPNEETGHLALSPYFNTAYKSALESEAFILNHKGELAKQDEIIIDKTGLSAIIGADLFCQLIETNKCLPLEKIDSKILSNQFFEKIEHVGKDNIYTKLINNTDLQEWYILADLKTKDIFNKWLIESEYKDVINSLPIFKFDDGWKSPNEVANSDKYVVLSTKFSHLKNICIKIGLHCSTSFDQEELYQIDETILFEKIYNKITLHNDIVKKFHQYRDTCAGVGCEEYYYENYYTVLFSELREGNFITKEQEQTLSQINPVYLTADDSDIQEDQLDKYNDMVYNHFIFHDFPNAISQFIAETELSPQEKLLLITTDFYGIGLSKIREIELFNNINNKCFKNGGEPTPLQNLLPYRANIPKYLEPYMICEKENFPELQKYLIQPEHEFEKVIMPNLSNIVETDLERSLYEIIRQYNPEGQQIRNIIKEFSFDCSMLPIVEESDTKTKKYFLDSIEKLTLHSSSTYKKDSYEYRVLQLALTIYDEPSNFSPKIYYNDQCIKDFSVSNDVVCEYKQNEKTKKVKLSLAKLLPQSQDQSDSIEQIKALFESKKDLDKFFVAKPKPINDVYEELNQLLCIPKRLFPIWNVAGNAHQYLFVTYYRRNMLGWFNKFVPKIELNMESEDFVYELLDFLFDNDISIEESPFTYHLKDYFIDKYFDSDYIFESEQLSPTIEKWANNDKKIKYLKDNGVRTTKCNAIQFRKLFLEDRPIIFTNNLSDEAINAGIEFVSTVIGYEHPFVGENQKKILLFLKDTCPILTNNWDNNKMEETSKEWNTKEYKEWIEDHHPHIFIYNGLLPSQISYENEIILNYEEEEYDYYFHQEEQALFVSSIRKIEDVLFEVAKDGHSNFDFDDYKFLCLEGKVSVSLEDVEKKDKTIASLSEDNRKKDEIIERYRNKYGDLSDGNKDNPKGEDLKESETNDIPKDMHSNSQNELILQSGKPIDRDGLSNDEQINAHKEAEKVIKEKLEKDGYDCSNWILDEETDPQDKEWHSYNQVDHIISPTGESINLVIKSTKGGYIYLSATDFEHLTSNSNNVLIVWDGENVHSVTAEDIFNKDSNVNLIFDTEYTPKHYYAALSKVFQYVKRTTFAVKNPCYNAYDSIKSFGMDSKTEGVQELFDDNDL